MLFCRAALKSHVFRVIIGYSFWNGFALAFSKIFWFVWAVKLHFGGRRGLMGRKKPGKRVLFMKDDFSVKVNFQNCSIKLLFQCVTHEKLWRNLKNLGEFHLHWVPNDSIGLSSQVPWAHLVEMKCEASGTSHAVCNSSSQHHSVTQFLYE